MGGIWYEYMCELDKEWGRTPMSMMAMVTALSALDWGVMSPYPTVVMVVQTKYIEAR